MLPGHDVVHARALGWKELENGRLLQAAELEGFEVLVTVDKNLRYQQSLSGRSISVITLISLFIDLKSIAPLAPQLLRELAEIRPGVFIFVKTV
jgi:predicted nucleic acid-binding protein